MKDIPVKANMENGSLRDVVDSWACWGECGLEGWQSGHEGKGVWVSQGLAG